MSSGATAPVETTGLTPTPPLLSVERVVVLASPFFLAAAAWLSGLVASNIPWAPPISPTGLAGVMIAVVLAVAAAIVKWLHGRQLPAIAALSPLKVTQHTLDTLYSEIEAYLSANADTFKGPKGEPGLSHAEIQSVVSGMLGNINETTIKALITREVTNRFSAAAGGGSTTGAAQAPGIAPA